MEHYKNFISISLLLMLFPFYCQSQGTTWTKEMVEGNKSYKEGKFDEATQRYETALLAKKGKEKASYNLGNSEYKQEKYDEAINHYESAFTQSQSYSGKANALFNMGNAFYQKEDYNAAIKSYKDALKYQPQDKETIENLAKAKLKKTIKQQEQEQQQKKKQQQNKDNKEEQQDQQDQKGNNQNQDQNQKDPNQEKNQENQKDQEKNSDQQDQPEDSQNQSETQKTNLTRGELDRLLKMIENEEKSVQKKLTRYNGKTSPQNKDW